MQTYPWHSVLAEFIGTFSLVVVGCDAISVQAQTGTLTHVGVAVSFGYIDPLLSGFANCSIDDGDQGKQISVCIRKVWR